MPIRPSFAVSPALQVAAAAAGKRQDLAQQQQQNAFRQQQLNEQKRQFDINAFMNIQNRQDNLDRMKFQAALDQQQMRDRARMQSELSRQQFEQQRQLYKDDDQARAALHEQDWQRKMEMQGQQSTAELNNLLRGFNDDGSQLFDPGMLNEDGKSKLAALNKEFDELQTQYRAGAHRPRDYFFAVDELKARAQSLSRMQQAPAPSFRERVEQETALMGRQLYSQDKDGNVRIQEIDYPDPELFPEGQRPGDTWFDPGKGLMSRNRYGEATPVKGASIMELRKDLVKEGTSLVEVGNEFNSIKQQQYQVDGAASLEEWISMRLQMIIPQDQMPKDETNYLQNDPRVASLQQPQAGAMPEITGGGYSPWYNENKPSEAMPVVANDDPNKELHLANITKMASTNPLTVDSTDSFSQLYMRFENEEEAGNAFMDGIRAQLQDPATQERFINEAAAKYADGSRSIPIWTRIVLEAMDNIQGQSLKHGSPEDTFELE